MTAQWGQWGSRAVWCVHCAPGETTHYCCPQAWVPEVTPVSKVDKALPPVHSWQRFFQKASGEFLEERLWVGVTSELLLTSGETWPRTTSCVRLFTLFSVSGG